MKELIAIQKELKAPKGQRNNFGNYNYRSCEDILEAVKPLCHQHNCLLTVSDEMVILGDRFYVKSTATIELADPSYRSKEEWVEHMKDEFCKRSVSAYARESETKKGMDDAQITGSASSYARKYALNGLFCIDDTKDADTMDNRTESQHSAHKPEKANTLQIAKLKDCVVELQKVDPEKAKRLSMEIGEGKLTSEIAEARYKRACEITGKKI
jgi:hypothetical protein